MASFAYRSHAVEFIATYLERHPKENLFIKGFDSALIEELGPRVFSA